MATQACSWVQELAGRQLTLRCARTRTRAGGRRRTGGEPFPSNSRLPQSSQAAVLETMAPWRLALALVVALAASGEPRSSSSRLPGRCNTLGRAPRGSPKCAAVAAPPAPPPPPSPPPPAARPLPAAAAAAHAQQEAQDACSPLPLPSGGALLNASDNGVTNPALLNTLVKVRGTRG